MPNKFTLIGLPGVGKTTIANQCAKILQSCHYNCEFISTDTMIHIRFKVDDPVILEFQRINSILIPPEMFESPSPTGEFIKIFGEEPLFRDLEELFIKNIISSHQASWFDLGGKAPLRDGLKTTLVTNKIIPVFLYASHDLILSRLADDNNWQKRSNYKNAGDPGWKDLALTHRQDRLIKYMDAASIVIEVNNQTPEALAKEIFYRVGEFEYACKTRKNDFTNQYCSFFSPANNAQNPISNDMIQPSLEEKY